jgi:hypothetical protein
MRYLLIFLFLLISIDIVAQKAAIRGRVFSEGQNLIAVSISVEGMNFGTYSDDSGKYFLQIPADTLLNLTFRHLGFSPQLYSIKLKRGEVHELNLELKRDVKILENVEVTSSRHEELREQVSIIKIDPLAAKHIPSPFNEFTRILATLPGVVSNNELSSAYSVRGGNFDENQIYVNDIPIYRPFLISVGQQEGLSFINPDLVGNIAFSSGGWQPKYGDKLSSNLNIEYKKPEKTSGSFSLGLMNIAAHFEGKQKNVSYLMGFRHRNSRYLLNTMETKGQYLPSFTDFQSLVNIDLTKNKYKESQTELSILTSYAANRYYVKPEARETNFGTFQQAFRLYVAFDGREQLNYDTWQSGMKLSHRFNRKFKSDMIASLMKTVEREYADVEGGYRLCDVNKDPGSSNFNECIYIRGIGSYYNYARNKLKANIFNLENRNYYQLNYHNKIEFGIGYSRENIRDRISEYSFIDSADFVTVTRVMHSDLNLQSNRLFGFFQNTTTIDSIQTLTYGIRFNYWSYNNQMLISPRMQYSIRPTWKRNVIFRTAAGLYQQPPFYRELRSFEGDLNPMVRAQSSWHFISGMDYIFKMWGRDFKFMGEAYYKHLFNVIPYDVDNVRIRYYAQNNATAFAKGMDFRINGEFIKGAESWFSLGILSTKENVEDDGRGFIRRPSDQRITLGVYFEDHIPNDPSLRMYLNLLFGSGLPFGPPNNSKYRNFLNGDQYKRLDLGLTKLFNFEKSGSEKKISFNSVWISAEILNVLGSDNPISYLWIPDVNNNQFAVPNSLSARFLNLRCIVRY